MEAEYEIWADFGLVRNTKKQILTDYEQLLGLFLSYYRGQKKTLNFF